MHLHLNKIFGKPPAKKTLVLSFIRQPDKALSLFTGELEKREKSTLWFIKKNIH